MKIEGIFVTVILCLTLLKSETIPSDQYKVLEQLDYSPPYFSLAGMTFLGKVDYVIDGDSVKLSFFFKDQLFKFNCRVAGIDTPQIRSGVVRQFGKDVKGILKNMIEGKIIKIQVQDKDKYGRFLTFLYGITVEGKQININNYLVTHKMAFVYDGGKKQAFAQTDYDDFKSEYENYTWPTFKNYPNTQ